MSLALFVIFFLTFILLITSQRESDQDTSRMMVAFWAGGFVVAIALFFSLSENQKTSQKFGADVRKNLPGIIGWRKSREGLVFAAGAAVPFVFAWAILLNFVMINTGVRAENVALVLNEKNLAYITSISKAAGADLKICPIANSRSGLVWPTHLLWHGIGSIS